MTGAKPETIKYPQTRVFAYTDNRDIAQLEKAAQHAGAHLYLAEQAGSGEKPHIVFPNAFSMFAFLRLTKQRRSRSVLKIPFEKITRPSNP